MEKSNQPVHVTLSELKDGDKEIVDAEFLVDLLESYRFGKDNVPAREFRSKAAATAPAPVNTTEIELEEDNDGSQAQGNNSVSESTSSLFSDSDPIVLESTVSETGSNEESETGSNEESETGSNEENGNNWLESSSTNLPNVENKRQRNGEDCEIEEEEENNERSLSDSEEKSNLEKLLGTQENYELGNEDEEKNERSSSDSEEKSNLENLLATQENYELYCPSCSTCITRNVVLKKRKRGKHVNSSLDLKPDIPVVEPDEPSDIEEMESPVKVYVPETRIEDDQEDKEGTIFTCLVCDLKYFIRLGKKFLQLDYIRGKPVEKSGMLS
ncbi:MEB2 [Arabidopsis thaliana]|uniref:MEB2 n=1 Tax=Arabidopsis thaliana TaxID=3702 RepID=A0A178UTP5_ARATH|nr:MEB2 [Arabidopsis thaliana]